MCMHLWRDMGPGEASTAMIDEHTRPQRNGLDLKGQRNGSKPLASVASLRREQPVTAEGKEGKPASGEGHEHIPAGLGYLKPADEPPYGTAYLEVTETPNVKNDEGNTEDAVGCWASPISASRKSG